MSLLDLQLPSPLPGWLPDETLFSLASRFHALSGNQLPSATCQALFGSARRGCEHDFPTRLAELCRRTQGTLGEAEVIARTRTLLPFYFPLKSASAAEAAIEALMDASVGMLKFQLGILTSRFRANHPLKGCPDCLIADRAAFGTPYWHLTHQFPGVWHCSIHDAVLQQSSVKSTGVDRFGWALPAEAWLTASDEAVEPRSSVALARFSAVVEAWTRLPMGIALDADKLAAAYRAALLGEFGPMALHPGTRSAMSAAFRTAVAPLRAISELRPFPASDDEAAAQLRPRILTPRASAHPLRHLAIIFWLFRDWQHFWHTYETARADPVVDPAPVASRHRSVDPREEAFLTAVQAGESVSGAARTVGVTATTGAAWATRLGIQVRLRPKTIKPEVRQALIAGLRHGAEKNELAERFAVSIQAVTRVLQTEPELRATWRVAQEDLRRRAARGTWESALKRFKGLPMTALRHEAHGAYAWLYRNDRAWLEQHRPKTSDRAGSNYSRVDWDRRDAQLSADVRRVAVELLSKDGVRRVELWQIYQLLPELKAKLGALDQLPLTLKAIQETTGRRCKDSKPQLF